MKSLARNIRLLGLAFLIAMAGVACRTSDPENTAARPWNSPRGWEHGLPSGINEGR